MNNIISTKTTSSIFLAALLVLGTISTILPSVQAQPYYEDTYEADYPSYLQDYEQESSSYKPDYKSKDSSSSVINKIKCNNINSNNNGVDVSLDVPNNDDAIAEAQAADNEGQATTANEWGYGNEYKQKDNGFKFVCVNNNDNENNVVVVNRTTPTPPTGSLTVNKEIFGCVDNNDMDNLMACSSLASDSESWIPCTDLAISNTPFCQTLPPNLFDIEVLGEIQQFEGSPTGTTVQNLQPDSFRVNEIVHENIANQLGYDPLTDSQCRGQGFDGGGHLENLNAQITYLICFQYQDEQGNDCNPITIGAEEKTCTVKNHISIAEQHSTPIDGLKASSSNTNTAAGSLASSFSSSPTTAQKTTEDGLTATEKITKLKQQWLELLP